MKVKRQKQKTKITGGKRKGEKKINILSNRGFGINEVVGIAAGLIIAVLVVMPGLRGFTTTVLDSITDWWDSVQLALFS